MLISPNHFLFSLSFYPLFTCRDPINLAVLHFKETGELAKLQHKWWYEKTQCKNDNLATTRNELTLSNLAGAFYILIGGLLLALAISLVEFCFKSQKATTTTSITSNSLQMTDTLKPKSRLPITSARDYDNGQVKCAELFNVDLNFQYVLLFHSTIRRVLQWNTTHITSMHIRKPDVTMRRSQRIRIITSSTPTH
jgi:hypothetical protein